jgi:hypothetical protein
LVSSLETSVDAKESLRVPLSFLRSLKDVVINPPMLTNAPADLQISRLSLCLERYARHLDDMMRSELLTGPSLRREQSFCTEAATLSDEALLREATRVVAWFSSPPSPPACSSNYSLPLASQQSYSMAIAAMRSPETPQRTMSVSYFRSFSPRLSESQADLFDARLSNFNLEDATETSRSSIASVDSKPCRITACRAVLGPPPDMLRDDYERFVCLFHFNHCSYSICLHFVVQSFRLHRRTVESWTTGIRRS